MQFNPDLLLKSEACRQLLDEVRDRLEQAAYYQAPVTVLALHVEDTTSARLREEERSRLGARTLRIVERSIRREKAEHRKITDVVVHIEPLYFIVLYNANRKNYLIPLGRIVEALREEAFATIGVAGALDYKRNIVIGGATWLPSHGPMTAEALFGRSLEALMMATASPQPDTYERLQIAKSANDQIKLHEYGWDEGFVLSGPGVLSKARAAEKRAEREAIREESSKGGANAGRAADDRGKKASEPSSPPIVSGRGLRIYGERQRRWWEFWKR